VSTKTSDVLRFYGRQCIYCGDWATTRDHLLPKSRGGSNRLQNLRPCCTTCNYAKGARTPEEWLGVNCPPELLFIEREPTRKTTVSKNVIMHRDSREVIPSIATPINCVITDPPYGMDFHSNSAQTPLGKQFTKKIDGDDNMIEAIELFHSVMGPILGKLADQAELYIFTAWHILEWWIPAVKELTFIQDDGTRANNCWMLDAVTGREVMRNPKGFDRGIRLKQMLIWEKGDPGQGDLAANWGCGHEVALYLKRGRRPIPKRRSAVLHFDKVRTGTNIHPTQKPVPLLKTLIEMSTDPGDLIVDPFSGSGSTSRAAKEMDRNSLAFEIEKDYFDRSTAWLADETLFTI
jgi:adenine-specific DNA-methyltransferase